MRNVPYRQLLFFALLAGCGSNGLPGTQMGYLASDTCSTNTSASSCTNVSGCRWQATGSTATTAICNNSDCATPTTGVCIANDPCLARDHASCSADTSCAWSQVVTLCPVGASCASGGFCHAKDPTGGNCACVSPIACPANGPCPQVECDCSGGSGSADGGSSGGGGACSCACPACAPGEDCAPCSCNCGDGGGGCNNGTCVCAGPVCAPGEDCPAIACDCGTGVTSPNPCAQYKDAKSCEASPYGCGVAPGPDGVFVCGQLTPVTPPPLCNCASCPAGQACPNICTCDSGGADGGISSCVPPTMPSPVTPPHVGPCPAIACPLLNCPNGVALDANGCGTCTCA